MQSTNKKKNELVRLSNAILEDDEACPSNKYYKNQYTFIYHDNIRQS